MFKGMLLNGKGRLQIIGLLLLCVICTQSMSLAAANEYVLGPGDVINIDVYDEPELNLSKVRVTRTGFISFPLIGKVAVVGKTINGLEATIEKRLKDGYLKQPKVTVSVETYRVFYVNGQLNRPGAFPYVVGLTVRKAIAVAGGLNDRASLKKIFLKREKSETEIKVEDMDTEMGPGDVLTIGESLF